MDNANTWCMGVKEIEILLIQPGFGDRRKFFLPPENLRPPYDRPARPLPGGAVRFWGSREIHFLFVTGCPREGFRSFSVSAWFLN